MRLKGSTIVLVPWFSTDGQKNWFNCKFTGDLDRRRLFREIAKHIKRALQRTVSKKWMRSSILIVNNPLVRDASQAEIDAFINRMELHEDEIEGHPESAGSPAQEAEGNLPSVSPQD